MINKSIQRPGDVEGGVMGWGSGWGVWGQVPAAAAAL